MPGQKVNAEFASYATVSGTTVSDIADAVSNYEYVRLKPGVTYTNDGTETITHDADNDAATVVNAWGAKIEVRNNPTVNVRDSFVDGGWFSWHGGEFIGSDSTGEVAMQSIDNIWSVFSPRIIRNCEVGMVAKSDTNWNEGNTYDFIGRDNDTALMLLGDASDASPPTGSSVTQTDNGGTQSFRNSTINIWSNPRETPIAQNTSYGVYESETKPYTSQIHITVGGDTNTVGWRVHGTGYPGTFVMFHYETPGTQSGGTGIVVDKMERHPAMMITRIGGESITEVTNNQDLPLLSWDVGIDQSGSTGIFGPKLIADGELGNPVQQFTTAFTDRSDGRSRVMKYTGVYDAPENSDLMRFKSPDAGSDIMQFEWRSAANRLNLNSPNGTDWDFGSGSRLITRDTGTSSSPILEIGNSGAGLYVDSNGDVYAVDEAGNTNNLTP